MADIGARKEGSFKAICTAPSINLTPMGSSMVPVAYTVLHDLSNSTSTAKTTCFNGYPAYLLDMTVQPMCTGDEPGTGKGIRSGTVDGQIKPTQGSKTFRIEGKSVVRNNDTCTLNGGNCPGLYVTMPIPGGLVQGGKLTKTADPAKVLTPAQLKAWSEKAWAWAKENAAKGVEGAKSMLHEVEQALDKPVEGVTGFAKDTANVTVGGANLLSMLASAEGASWVQYAESISPTPGGEAIKAQAEQILQNPGSIPLIPEPFPNLTDAEKGGALLSNLSPKAGLKLLVVGMTKTVGKDLEKALVKEGAKALEKSAAKDAEKAALKKAEEDAAKKQAEEAAKKSKPHEPQKEGKPEGEGSPGDGAKINPKKKLPPNAEFELNGYKYKTDSKGRVVEVKGQLKDESAARNNYAQRTVGKGEGRLADDHGGHLIGSQFGGSGEKANLVPMHKDINNYHSGEWGQMEKKWASALEKGESVEVKIMPKYTDDTMRPSSFSITEKIGDKIRKIDIENPVK